MANLIATGESRRKDVGDRSKSIFQLEKICRDLQIKSEGLGEEEDIIEKVKTQNVLRPQDIDKISNAYKARTTEDKYSYVAALSEIAENDYNLNIPRYVDTFEEEAAVNLKAVSKELQKLEKEMKTTDDTIAKYCKELGIENPF